MLFSLHKHEVSLSPDIKYRISSLRSKFPLEIIDKDECMSEPIILQRKSSSTLTVKQKGKGSFPSLLPSTQNFHITRDLIVIITCMLRAPLSVGICSIISKAQKLRDGIK